MMIKCADVLFKPPLVFQERETREASESLRRAHLHPQDLLLEEFWKHLFPEDELDLLLSLCPRVHERYSIVPASSAQHRDRAGGGDWDNQRPVPLLAVEGVCNCKADRADTYETSSLTLQPSTATIFFPAIPLACIPITAGNSGPCVERATGKVR